MDEVWAGLSTFPVPAPPQAVALGEVGGVGEGRLWAPAPAHQLWSDYVDSTRPALVAADFGSRAKLNIG